MRRWVCPSCGSAVNAPDAPRKDDARRYCLTCTAKTGRLVARTCPALDRRRTEKAAARSVRSVAQRERERAAKLYDGLDVLAEARRVWRTPTLKALHGHFKDRSHLPEFEVRRSRRKPYTTGRAGYRRVVLTLGGDRAEVQAVILHELVHTALFRRGRGDVGHGPLFRSTYRSAAREAFPGVDVPDTGQQSWRMVQDIADGIRGVRRFRGARIDTDEKD